MKKKFIILTITGLLLASLAACGGSKTPDASKNTADQEAQNQNQDSQGTSDTIQGDIEENHGSDDTEGSSDSAENASENQSGDLTFADLAKYSFEFCSGAGGWSTDFEIEKDGSFKGSYHDSDMGDTGDDYENGTMYLCGFSGKFTDLTKINDYTYQMKMENLIYDETPGKEEIADGVKYIYTENGTMYLCGFSGKFTDLTKINDYTYQMKMENLIYDETPGKEEIADGVKYIYTDVYGLEGTDTFKVYLPGAPVRDLSEDVYFWVRWANDDSEEGTQDTLTIPIIVNEEMGYGIYSYERQTPYEEAQSTLNTYQASYDAAEEELKKATLQSRMDDYAMQMYDISDSCLNEIWNLVKYNTSEEKFNEILTEQRKWIADKEAAGNEILDQNDGSSAQMDSSLKMAELTMERCEELADYLK